ncbi:MAG: Fe2+-dependent dioxygenase [Pseudomonadota bacterium]
MIDLPQVLDAARLTEARAMLDAADWVDGRATAGHQSAQVKRNRQLAEGSPAARKLGDLVLAALERHPLFLTAALPARVFPPLFNRYEGGEHFGAHVDNAIRQVTGTAHRIRTDLSCTLFLSDPADYDGGELVVEDHYAERRVKLAAGDAILYPATSLHRVEPVTSGARTACFFWVQSMVRDATERAMLLDLDLAINGLRDKVPEDAGLVSLTGLYHNLLRRWGEV